MESQTKENLASQNPQELQTQFINGRQELCLKVLEHGLLAEQLQAGLTQFRDRAAALYGDELKSIRLHGSIGPEGASYSVISFNQENSAGKAVTRILPVCEIQMKGSGSSFAVATASGELYHLTPSPEPHRSGQEFQSLNNISYPYHLPEGPYATGMAAPNLPAKNVLPTDYPGIVLSDGTRQVLTCEQIRADNQIPADALTFQSADPAKSLDAIGAGHFIYDRKITSLQASVGLLQQELCRSPQLANGKALPENPHLTYQDKLLNPIGV